LEPPLLFEKPPVLEAPEKKRVGKPDPYGGRMQGRGFPALLYVPG